jgi:hypothetical protein
MTFYIDQKALLGIKSEFENVNKMAEAEVTVLARAMATELVGRVFEQTPKRTGATVSHWVLTKKDYSQRRYKKNSIQYGFEEKALDFIAKLGPYEKFHISINDPHMLIIDNGSFVPPNPGPSKDTFPGRKGKTWVSGGYSTQAPSGVTIPVTKKIKVKYKKQFKFEIRDMSKISNLLLIARKGAPTHLIRDWEEWERRIREMGKGATVRRTPKLGRVERRLNQLQNIRASHARTTLGRKK